MFPCLVGGPSLSSRPLISPSVLAVAGCLVHECHDMFCVLCFHCMCAVVAGGEAAQDMKELTATVSAEGPKNIDGSPMRCHQIIFV